MKLRQSYTETGRLFEKAVLNYLSKIQPKQRPLTRPQPQLPLLASIALTTADVNGGQVFHLSHTGRAHDKGIDLLGYLKDIPVAVQCKHSKHKVGVGVIRELVGSLNKSKTVVTYVSQSTSTEEGKAANLVQSSAPVTLGMVASSSGFTQQAKKLASTSTYPLLLLQFNKTSSAMELEGLEEAGKQELRIERITVSKSVATHFPSLYFSQQQALGAGNDKKEVFLCFHDSKVLFSLDLPPRVCTELLP